MSRVIQPIALLILFSLAFPSEATPAKPLNSDDESAAFPVPEAREYVGKLVELVDLLGKGEVDLVSEKLDSYMIEPPNWANAPGLGRITQIQNQIVIYRTWKPEYESVDLVSYNRISSACYTFSFVANGKSGPSLFSFVICQVKDNWKVVTFEHNHNIVQIARTSPMQKIAKPIRYKFESKTETAQADSKTQR